MSGGVGVVGSEDRKEWAQLRSAALAWECRGARCQSFLQLPGRWPLLSPHSFLPFNQGCPRLAGLPSHPRARTSLPSALSPK